MAQYNPALTPNNSMHGETPAYHQSDRAAARAEETRVRACQSLSDETGTPLSPRESDQV